MFQGKVFNMTKVLLFVSIASLLVAIISIILMIRVLRKKGSEEQKKWTLTQAIHESENRREATKVALAIAGSIVLVLIISLAATAVLSPHIVTAAPPQGYLCTTNGAIIYLQFDLSQGKNFNGTFYEIYPDFTASTKRPTAIFNRGSISGTEEETTLRFTFNDGEIAIGTIESDQELHVTFSPTSFNPLFNQNVCTVSTLDEYNAAVTNLIKNQQVTIISTS
jgi:hypothetical protein